MQHITFEKEFYDVYEDFFVNHDYVVCGPHGIRWQAGGISQKADFLTLLSKVHLRTFLGIKPTNTGCITRGEISFYDRKKNRFLSHPMQSIYPQWNTKKTTIDEIVLQHYPQGAHISLLSETGRGHGLGFTGVWTTLLAHHLSEEHSEEHTVLTLAHTMESALRDSQALGDRGHMTLQDNTLPQLYFHTHGASFGYGSHTFAQECPFDIAVIFSGEATHIEKVDQKIHHNTLKLSRFSESFVSLTQELGVPSDHPNVSLFQDQGGYNHVTNALILLNSMIIQGYHHLTYEYDDTQIYKILDYMEDIHGLVSIIHGDDLFVDTYMKLFYKYQSSPHEKTAIIPAYSGKHGGGYICFAPQGTSRHTREHTFQSITNTFPQAYVEYLSYRDPIETPSLTVRQDLANNIYSRYLSEGSAIYYDNRGTKSIGMPSDLLTQHTAGITLDAIRNKVYINGIKATKDNIKSQATTVEVIGRLLEHMGEEVSNLAFGPSTYTRQQNQMLGKIIGPLRKIFLESFGEELPITCTGSLRDFSLTLQSSKTPIGIIAPITHE